MNEPTFKENIYISLGQTSITSGQISIFSRQARRSHIQTGKLVILLYADRQRHKYLHPGITMATTPNNRVTQ